MRHIDYLSQTPAASTHPGSFPRNRRRLGFTLLELLVVVAIVGLLAALLLPSLGRARGAARRIVCSSHLRQLGQAMSLYADATEGEFYPPLYGVGNPTEYLWMAKLMPFGMKESLFFCPSDPNLNPHSTIYDPADNLSHSYVLNAFDVAAMALGGCQSARMINHPSQLIMAGEKKSSETDFYLDFVAGEFDRVLEQTRHGVGANFLFTDNHIERLRVGQSLAPVNFWTLSIAD